MSLLEETVEGGVKLNLKTEELKNDHWFAMLKSLDDDDAEPIREMNLVLNDFAGDEPATPGFIQFIKATVGDNRDLIKIRCDGSLIYAENNEQGVVWKEISKNRNIKHLCMYIGEFNDLNKVRALCKIFNNNQTLVSLNIQLTNYFNPIENNLTLELARSLRTTALERLQINHIDDKGFEILFQNLPPRLVYLNISNNQFTEEIYPMLQAFIKSNRTLKELIFYDDLAIGYLDRYSNINASKIPVKILALNSFEATLALKDYKLDLTTEDMSGNDWKMFVDEINKNYPYCWRILDVNIHNGINLKYFNQLLTVLGEQCHVLCLTIRYDKLDKEKQINLFHTLYKNNSLYKLCLSFKIDPDVYNILLSIINDKSNITHLTIDDNIYMDDKDLTKLAQCLASKTKFEELILKKTSIGDKGFQVLLNFLPNSIKHLELVDNLVTAKSLPAVLAFAKKHPNCETFILRENGISSESKEVNVDDILEKIGKAIENNGCDYKVGVNEYVKQKFSEIDDGSDDISINFYENSFRDDHALELCNALKMKSFNKNRNWSIDLSFNPRISSFGFQHLGNSLSNIPIVNLNLVCCEMNEEKIKSFFSGFAKNRTLKILSLGSNQIDSRAMEHIVRYLQNNTTLTELDLCNNNIKDEGALQLASVLSRTRLQELTLYTNSISDRGCISILSSLPSTLVKLDLSNNQITKASLDKLIQFLSSNRTLKDFYIDPNPIFGKHWYKDHQETVASWMKVRQVLDKNNICELH